MRWKIFLFIIIDFLIVAISSFLFLGNNPVYKEERLRKKINDNDINPLIKNNISDSIYLKNNNTKVSDDKIETELINNKDKLYTVKEFEIDNINVYLLVVYDPSKVHMMVSKVFNTGTMRGLEHLTSMIERYGAVAGINGGGFFDVGSYYNDKPMGIIIKDKEVLFNNHGKIGQLIGFNNENKLTFMETTGYEAVQKGMRDAMEFGPYLIVNGHITKEAEKMENRKASRTIIAQREDGTVLMLVTDGGTFIGVKMSELINLLLEYGAINAANLDGGASAQLVVKGKLYNYAKGSAGNLISGGRRVINGWGVFETYE